MTTPIKVPGLVYALSHLGDLYSKEGKKERVPLETIHLTYPKISMTIWHLYGDLAVKEHSRTEDEVILKTVVVEDVDKFLKHLDDLQR